MNAADLKSCSDAVLHVIEAQGFAGFWSWSFASDRQHWSPGLFRILGADPSVTAAGYDLLVGLLHPDDRMRLASAAELLQGHVLPDVLVRLIRPDGEMRALSVLSELRVSPEGRPLSVSGIVLDVTERERLRRILATEKRRRQALYLTSFTTTYSVGVDRLHDFPGEMAQVHGASLHEINVDPFVMIVPEERAAFRERALGVHVPRAHFQGTSRERLATGEIWQFRIVGIPLWDEAGLYLGRAGLKYALGPSGEPVRAALPTGDNRIRRALEQVVQGRHLRAARGLLDWSMATLAAAAGLSLSTVRRLEDDAEGPGSRARHKAVAALREAGIRFIAMDDGTLAVAKL